MIVIFTFIMIARTVVEKIERIRTTFNEPAFHIHLTDINTYIWHEFYDGIIDYTGKLPEENKRKSSEDYNNLLCEIENTSRDIHEMLSKIRNIMGPKKCDHLDSLWVRCYEYIYKHKRLERKYYRLCDIEKLYDNTAVDILEDISTQMDEYTEDIYDIKDYINAYVGGMFDSVGKGVIEDINKLYKHKNELLRIKRIKYDNNQ